jgi:2-polyprenyl-3-methyl-5-hydroxy-6-metoxy-1,4-benzoquinol methylase
MLHLHRLRFTWVSGGAITDGLLEECSELYSRHYGVYGEGVTIPGVRPGDPIKMAPRRMRRLLDVDGARAGLVHLDGLLVAYAFLVWGNTPVGGVTSWVTQLVVHGDYRNQKVATRLLHAAWGLSDQFAWGLATANPYAVRALEAATRRTCDLHAILAHLDHLRRFTEAKINYFKDAPLDVTPEKSNVNTGFFVSHSTLEEKMERACKNGKAWTLGPLSAGTEWLAVTFQSQPPRDLTVEELDRLLADQDGIVKEAYARMLLDTSHKWMANTSAEVDFILANLSLREGASILDAGCGLGRHAIELAKRGYQVVGVDFVGSLIERANAAAAEAGVARAEFVKADCRMLDLGRQFDAALCLYDVVGSFPKDEDNIALLRGVTTHLKPDGPLLMSVLNRGLVEAQAVHRGRIRDSLAALLGLPPSQTMQKSGEIFNPQYYLYDPDTGVVYRKEQFKLDEQIPCELIVRDRRYTAEELGHLCRSAGVDPVWVRHVRVGHWEDNFPPDDPQAKEVLLLGKKR